MKEQLAIKRFLSKYEIPYIEEKNSFVLLESGIRIPIEKKSHLPKKDWFYLAMEIGVKELSKLDNELGFEAVVYSFRGPNKKKIYAR